MTSNLATTDLATPAPAYAAPLRAVDEVRVDGADGGALTVRATKRVSVGDPYLEGHFPDVTIYPGVFVLESLRQAVVAALAPDADTVPRIVVVRSVRCLAPLLAGDLLHLDATLRPLDARPGWLARAVGDRGDGVRAATLTVEFDHG